MRDDNVVNWLVALAEAREADFHDHAALTKVDPSCDGKWKIDSMRELRLCGG